MTIFIPTKLGVVKMDLEDRLKFKNKIQVHQGDRKINVTINHEGKAYHLHRLILGVTRKDILVDHKNGNRLDVRKKNLLKVKIQTNNLNKADYKKKSDLPRGVRKRGDKFVAVITRDKKSTHLGTFRCPLEAHEEFKKEHVRTHGSKSVYKKRLS